MANVARRTLADRVAETLRKQILAGVYAPGEKLSPELALASELQVNRFTIREAMNKLEQLHLIERRPGSGTVVLDYARHANTDILEDLVLSVDGTINTRVLADILETARILTSEVAALAAERRTDADMCALSHIVRQMQREANLSRLLWLDFDFNWALAGTSRNIVPQLVLNSVRGLLRQHAHLLESLFVSPGSITQGYEHVVEAIQLRDPERARSLVKWIWTGRHLRFVELVGELNRPSVAGPA